MARTMLQRVVMQGLLKSYQNNSPFLQRGIVVIIENKLDEHSFHYVRLTLVYLALRKYPFCPGIQKPSTKMEKSGAFNNMYLIVPLVLLGLSTMAGAVDIIFYSDSGACSGSGYSFNGIGGQICCIANGGSVLFRDMDGCKTSLVYRNGGCDSGQVGSATGNTCYVGGGFTSGYWYQSCRRRSLLNDATPDMSKCVSQAKPTGLVFTEDSSKGSWILKPSNAVELSSQVENMTDAEKVNWFKANGASFENTAVTQNVNLH
ncbi:hypothetical protein AXG93_4757s1020 [Marchantia polymorpha subsp. ruderalis]|uniref:Uncharacterized protein n=1 Tax=Marchantia polymorpha subsp. ruderalis TaxID=1480154 RepID=A0A176W3Q0_MARPO|nr:hypothetical protein AXG93_4757s1020 [Marchantia polymorpha subsp. ruderalis]